DAVLRVIKIDAQGVGRQPLAAFGVLGEQLPQLQFTNLLIVAFERLPGGAACERTDIRSHFANPSVGLRISFRWQSPASGIWSRPDRATCERPLRRRVNYCRAGTWAAGPRAS